MKYSLIFLCALLLLQRPLTTRASDIEVENSSNKTNIEAEASSPVVELNPDFEEEAYDSDSDFDLSDDESDSELTPTESAKKSLSALLKNKKKQIAEKRAMITLILAVFAFRREIFYAVLVFLKKLFINPKTGKMNLNLTQLLKLLLFIDIARKSFGKGMNSSNWNSNPAIQKVNPLIGSLLKTLMTNPAYIPPLYQHYTFERVNERYVKDGLALQKAIHTTHNDFKWTSSSPLNEMETKIVRMVPKESNTTAIILDLTQLGPKPSEVIRDQVSFLLSCYREIAMWDKEYEPKDLEVIVILESPGGSAVDFGLAAQQLLRLRDEPKILLTICVDRVAASGGYMLACTASPGQLLAAPFSVVGSIGVIGQILNINDLLERQGVTPVVLRGGKNKAPLGMVGKITKHSMEKTQVMIDDTHRAFKQHVVDSRPILKRRIEKVGTGDVWLGSDAIRLDLVDRIATSDEYIAEKIKSGARVLKMVKCPPRSLLFARQMGGGVADMGVGPIHQLVRTFLTFLKTNAGQFEDPRISLRDGIDEPMEVKLPIAVTTVETPKMKL